MVLWGTVSGSSKNHVKKRFSEEPLENGKFIMVLQLKNGSSAKKKYLSAKKVFLRVINVSLHFKIYQICWKR